MTTRDRDSALAATGAELDAGLDPRRWLTILVLAAAGFSIGTDLYVLPAVIPAMARDLRIEVAVAARMLALYAVLVAVVAPPLTVLTRRLDRRTLLVASVALLVLTNLLTAITPGLAWLAGTRVLAALAAAVLSPIRTATAGQLAPPGARARAVAVATAGLSAALVVGAPVGLWVAVSFGWRFAFVGAAGVALLALGGLLAFLPTIPPAGSSSLRVQIAVLRDRALLLVLLSNVAALCAIYVLLTFLAPVVQHVTSFRAGAVSLVFALYGVAGIGGNWLAGWAGDRLGTPRVMVGGLLLSALSTAALALTFPVAGSLAADLALPLLVVGWGVGSWGFYALQFHRLIELAPAAPALAVAWSSPATFVGVSLGAFLGGLTLQRGSLEMLPWVAAAGFGLGAVLVAAARDGGNAPEDG